MIGSQTTDEVEPPVKVQEKRLCCDDFMLITGTLPPQTG
jgi:hypothetical protein